MISTATAKALWEGKARTLAFFVLALWVAVLIALTLTSKPVHAETTFTVDRSDDPDLTTTSTADDCIEATANDCSLRGAITAANSNNNPTESDTINFAIPEDPNNTADDVKTILVDGTDDPASSTNLPDITEAVEINGYTQPWASPNTNTALAKGTNANLVIELNGASRGSSGIGLTISASDVVVKGLAINCFTTGIFIPSSGSRAAIEGNFIGPDPGVCTTHNGVNIFGSDNTIGGQEPAARNLISGNLVNGLSLGGNGGNTVQGNLIGTKANGIEGQGNHDGVEISSPNNTVGGIDSDRTDNNNPANRIAFNGDNGVLVFGVSGFSSRNRILSNSIFSNGGLGIDLTATSVFSPDGVTANDKRDEDTGANNLQNFPKITSTTTTVFGTTINGTLNSLPRRTFTIQFFSSPEANTPNGFGEGQTFLRSKTVTTNDRGNATFSVATSVLTGKVVTATATSVSGNTSEFSRGFTVP